MRIGIFGGSFDPVHKEHVRLAESAVKELSLDMLYVMPAHTPPHKRGKTLSSDEDRFEMCRIAFAHIPGIQVSDYEMKKGGTSYTYLTCRHFAGEFPGAELFWLVGTDMLRDFPTWREPEDILKNAVLAVCARAEEKGWAEREQKAFSERFGKKFSVIGYEGKDVSSTRIRVLTAAGEKIAPYVGGKVADYILDKGLYRIKNAPEALDLEKPSRREHSIRVAFLAAELSRLREKSAARFPPVGGVCSAGRGAGSRPAPVCGGVCCRPAGGDGRGNSRRDPLPHQRPAGHGAA